VTDKQSQGPAFAGKCVDLIGKYRCQCPSGFFEFEKDGLKLCGARSKKLPVVDFSTHPEVNDAVPSNGQPEWKKTHLWFPNTMKFTCDKGYSLNGKASGLTSFIMSLTTDGAWQEAPKACKPVQCPSVREMNKAKPAGTGVKKFKDELKYTCDKGYTLDGQPKTLNTFTLMCSHDGTYVFTGTAQACQPVTCGPRPTIEHSVGATGEMKFDSPQSVHTCDPGYTQAAGAVKVKCTADGSYEYVGKGTKKCQPMKCEVKSVAKSKSDVTAVVHPNKVTYTAEPGYEFAPNENTAIVQCDKKGSAINPAKPIKIECEVTPKLRDWPHADTQKVDKLKFQEELKITCDKGYSLDGTGKGKLQQPVKCKADKTFETPKDCKIVKCVPPTKKHTEHPTGTYEYGQYVTYKCKGGHYANRGDDKAWFKNPIMEFKGQCDETGVPSPLGSCKDLNECDDTTLCKSLTNPSIGGKCVNNPTPTGATPPLSKGYTCECDTAKGFKKDVVKADSSPYLGGDACRNVDDCPPDACSPGGKCIDMLNGFKCECPEGYNNVKKQQCSVSQHTGKPLEKCEKCERKSCGSAPAGGNAEQYKKVPMKGFSSVDDGKVLYKDTIIYKCKEGFMAGDENGKPTGQEYYQAHCRANEQFTYNRGAEGMDVGKSNGKCVPKPCTNFPAVENVETHSTEDAKFGDTPRVLQCKQGYSAKGSEGLTTPASISVKCASNGRFTLEGQSCSLIKCTVPETRSHATPDTMVRVVMDAKVAYECDTGYSTDPTDPAANQVEFQCQKQGDKVEFVRVGANMKGDQCEKVECKGDQTKGDPNLVAVQDAVFGDTVTYTCKPGFAADPAGATMCKADGTFDGEKPKCAAKPCPVLDLSAAGLNAPQASCKTGEVKFGEKLECSCNDNHSVQGQPAEAGKKIMVTCNADGSYGSEKTYLPQCEPIKCGVAKEPQHTTYTRQGLALTAIDPKVVFTCNSGYLSDTNPIEAKCEAGTDNSWAVQDAASDTCYNVNDCPDDACDGRGKCVDGVNTFECACFAGSMQVDGPSGNKTCVDIPDCPLNTGPGKTWTGGDVTNEQCSLGGCTDKNQTFHCTCLAGWTNDGKDGELCRKNKCSAGAVAHATIANGNPELGGKTTYTCETGYKIAGSDKLESKVECVAVNEQDQGPEVDLVGKPTSCEKRDCPQLPKMPQSEDLTADKDMKFDEEVTVNCKSGYTGAGATTTITCAVNNDNGMYLARNPPLSTCTPVQCDVSHYQNVEAGAQSWAHGQADKLKITCSPGFVLEANKPVTTENSEFFVECTPNGKEPDGIPKAHSSKGPLADDFIGCVPCICSDVPKDQNAQKTELLAGAGAANLGSQSLGLLQVDAATGAVVQKDLKEDVHYADTVKWTCKDGYYIGAPAAKTALANADTEYSGVCEVKGELQQAPENKCHPVECTFPSVGNADIAVPAEFNFESAPVNGTCKKGHTTSAVPGGAAAVQVKCNTDGSTTPSKDDAKNVCKPVVCQVPTGAGFTINLAAVAIMDSADMSLALTSSSAELSVAAGTMVYGNVKKVDCADGYTADGEPDGPTAYNVICDADGVVKKQGSEDDKDILCKCDSPGAGTAGHNGFECTDGTRRYCAANEECYEEDSFVKGKWSQGCRVPSGPLAVGSIVALKGGHHGKYCADEGSKIVCNRDAINAWEKFTVEDAGDGKIALRGGHDGKLCADEKDRIKCNRGQQGQWEKFEVEPLGGMVVALKGGNDGKWCSDDGRVKCNRGAVQGWEKFTVVVVTPAPMAMAPGLHRLSCKTKRWCSPNYAKCGFHACEEQGSGYTCHCAPGFKLVQEGVHSHCEAEDRCALKVQGLECPGCKVDDRKKMFFPSIGSECPVGAMLLETDQNCNAAKAVGSMDVGALSIDDAERSMGCTVDGSGNVNFKSAASGTARFFSACYAPVTFIRGADKCPDGTEQMPSEKHCDFVAKSQTEAFHLFGPNDVNLGAMENSDFAEKFPAGCSADAQGKMRWNSGAGKASDDAWLACFIPVPIRSCTCKTGFEQTSQVSDGDINAPIMTCTRKVCGDYDIPAGKLRPKTVFKDRVFEDEVEIECVEGYSFDGKYKGEQDSYKVTCKADRSFDKSGEKACKPLDCPITAPANGNFDPAPPASVKFPLTATVSCKVGYEAVLGAEARKDQTVGCGTDGKATSTLKACQKKKCKFVPNTVHGFIASPEGEQTMEFEDEREIKCTEGYEFNGKPTFKAKCKANEDVENKDQVCSAKICKSPGQGKFTKPVTFDRLYFPSKYVIYCQTGYFVQGTTVDHYEIECQADETFTKHKTCVKSKCPAPSSEPWIASLNLVVKQGTESEVGDQAKQATFSCKEGYESTGSPKNDEVSCKNMATLKQGGKKNEAVCEVEYAAPTEFQSICGPSNNDDMSTGAWAPPTGCTHKIDFPAKKMCVQGTTEMSASPFGYKCVCPNKDKLEVTAQAAGAKEQIICDSGSCQKENPCGTTTASCFDSGFGDAPITCTCKTGYIHKPGETAKPCIPDQCDKGGTDSKGNNLPEEPPTPCGENEVPDSNVANSCKEHVKERKLIKSDANWRGAARADAHAFYCFDKVQYECKEGYETPEGTQKSPEYELAPGAWESDLKQWSEIKFTCQKKKCDVSALDLAPFGDVHQPPSSTKKVFGDVLELRCQEGFTLEGAQDGATSIELKCGADSMLTVEDAAKKGKACEPQKCKPFTTPDSMERHDSGVKVHGEMVQLSCKHRMFQLAQVNGQDKHYEDIGVLCLNGQLSTFYGKAGSNIEELSDLSADKLKCEPVMCKYEMDDSKQSFMYIGDQPSECECTAEFPVCKADGSKSWCQKTTKDGAQKGAPLPEKCTKLQRCFHFREACECGETYKDCNVDTGKCHGNVYLNGEYKSNAAEPTDTKCWFDGSLTDKKKCDFSFKQKFQSNYEVKTTDENVWLSCKRDGTLTTIQKSRKTEVSCKYDTDSQTIVSEYKDSQLACTGPQVMVTITLTNSNTGRSITDMHQCRSGETSDCLNSIKFDDTVIDNPSKVGSGWRKVQVDYAGFIPVLTTVYVDYTLEDRGQTINFKIGPLLKKGDMRATLTWTWGSGQNKQWDPRDLDTHVFLGRPCRPGYYQLNADSDWLYYGSQMYYGRTTAQFNVGNKLPTVRLDVDETSYQSPEDKNPETTSFNNINTLGNQEANSLTIQQCSEIHDEAELEKNPWYNACMVHFSIFYYASTDNDVSIAASRPKVVLDKYKSATQAETIEYSYANGYTATIDGQKFQAVPPGEARRGSWPDRPFWHVFSCDIRTGKCQPSIFNKDRLPGHTGLDWMKDKCSYRNSQLDLDKFYTNRHDYPYAR
jgi:hypothetical protein